MTVWSLKGQFADKFGSITSKEAQATTLAVLAEQVKIDGRESDKKERLSMLSQSLRQLRSQRELTQAEVAKKVGITVLAYRNLEFGPSQPKPETLRRLAAALGVPLARTVGTDSAARSGSLSRPESDERRRRIFLLPTF